MTNEHVLAHDAEKLKQYQIDSDICIMEVCGTHTTEYFRTGVKDIFPPRLRLVDGPGCPVCVTPNHYLDHAIALAGQKDCIIATFGDMVKVPSSYSSLARESAGGARVEVVYSPVDALDIARQNPNREVVFLSVGFETTAPTEAVTVKQAKEQNLKNFSLLPGNKLTVPAVKALLDAEEVNIDGFILPGHVSAIIGTNAWKFLGSKYNKPAVVTGFDDHDLLKGTLLLLTLISEHKPHVLNEYTRVVRDGGNQHAMDMIYSVFDAGDSEWRGIGVIPGSGLLLKDEYADFDATKKITVDIPEPKEHPGCRCGDLLRGLILPTECPLFGRGCNPEHPIGPCMVSTEGPCAAYYKYGR